MGVLDAIHAALAREADLEWLMIDSTIVRAHQQALALAGKKGADAQGLGRSRGGLSTKIHAAGDALGNPVRLIGSPGQRNDIAFAHELIEGFAPDVTIADKGYDADHLCDKIAESGGQAVIPPKRNRTFKRPYDAELYKERNIIERFFNKLNSSAASPHATTSCSPTSWASSNSPRSLSGSNSKIVTTA
jgi:putative transposase